MPQYAAAFRCLAGRCPHTCCAAGWEVPVDADTAARYGDLPGPLGARVRAALDVDAEGESCFPLRGGACALLTPEGLCGVQLALGEEAIPLVCRTHPRFCYEYGPLRERGLCASCPEAARLILDSPPVICSTQEEGEGEEAPPLLAPLLSAREAAFSLLEAEEVPLPERLQALLLFANEVQVLLDEGRTEDLGPVCAFYREELPVPDPEGLPPRQAVMEQCLRLLEGLEILQPRWRRLLEEGRSGPSGAGAVPDRAGARAAAYFLYRHWLRGVWDGDVLSWAEFAVLGTAVSARLAPLQEEGFPGAFRLFCQELEHSERNMEAVQDALWDGFSLPELLSLAQL